MIAKIQAQLSSTLQEIKSGSFNVVLTRFSDLILVACITLIVGLMIVPLPTFLLDVFLTANITIAITILMVSIYVSNGAQIASFPTILLLTTLYRLALEISSTRLILLQADAGEVIKAFGQFVVGGNFVVGAVIFLIITLVQFLVITKGSERVAEVAARFTLDAMPGKQMSIDADLRAGSIDFKVARKRRQALAKESQFYGAMDGAMKFVKGDAIAGIIITVVNIVGGLIIGVAMNGMPAGEAVQTYSILTIGDGLVAQIPALLISISAGMVVTRVASEDEPTNLGRDIASQILAQPKAIAVAAGILFVLGMVPGMPKVAFLLLTVITGGISFGLYRAQTIKGAAALQRQSSNAPPPFQLAATPPDPKIVKTFPVIFEVGGDLALLVGLDNPNGKAYFDKLVALRNNLYSRLGVLFPPLRVDKVVVPLEEGNNYRFWLNEAPVGTGRILNDRALVNASAETLAEYGIEALIAVNPADHQPAAWIERKDIKRVLSLQVKVWDTDDILLLHITGFLRAHAMDFLTIQEVQWLVEEFRKLFPALVDEVVPKIVSLQQLTNVLQRLLSEQVSIKDMKAIFQAMSAWNRSDGDSSALLTEHVRLALRRRLCFGLSKSKPQLLVYQLDPEIEDIIRGSLRQDQSGEFLAMDEQQTGILVEALRNQIGYSPMRTQSPVLVVDGTVRRFMKGLLGMSFPELSFLSYAELAPEITVEPIGTITLNRPLEPEQEQPALN
jgi:type III secretion protein V